MGIFINILKIHSKIFEETNLIFFDLNFSTAAVIPNVSVYET